MENINLNDVFLGIEHCGMYVDKAKAKEIIDFYVNTFGFKADDGEAACYLYSNGTDGAMEVFKKPEQNGHIAIKVSDFELACKILKEKGVELTEPIDAKDRKVVFLKKNDPFNNRIHLVWRKKK